MSEPIIYFGIGFLLAASLVFGARPLAHSWLGHEERAKLEQDMATLKRQVEATWASERMANAVLRERINDVAGEVVRVAHALEGLGSPIETMLAGKAAELDAAGGSALTGGNGGNPIPPINTGGDDSKSSLARRVRSLQKRAARVSSAGGT